MMVDQKIGLRVDEKSGSIDSLKKHSRLLQTNLNPKIFNQNSNLFKFQNA